MTNEPKVLEAADRIWSSIQTKSACHPVRDLLGETDLDAAYSTQQINTDRKIKAGAAVVGYKIGLTSFAVQKQLGVDQPDFGVLTDKMLVAENHIISWAELMQPKVEAEIAFIISEDVHLLVESVHELKSKIECAVASIEIVGSRIENWNIRITDTIADNASASHFVLGSTKVPLAEVDLVGCKMKMSRDKQIVSEGQGVACMDNPLNAALWLVNTMISKGNQVRKGDIILSGALGPMVVVNRGDQFTAEIEGLGAVSVSFEK